MDAYDAMTQDRPYRKRMSEAEALQEIKDNEALQFDPKIAEAFIELMKKEK
jgi:HD-GYP domain-containing protein (c-di-GMP phosphodiesterase class II)